MRQKIDPDQLIEKTISLMPVEKMPGSYKSQIKKIMKPEKNRTWNYFAAILFLLLGSWLLAHNDITLINSGLGKNIFPFVLIFLNILGVGMLIPVAQNYLDQHDQAVRDLKLYIDQFLKNIKI